MTLSDIRQAIRELPNLSDQEAVDILATLVTRFKKNTSESDAILDAILVIEGRIMVEKEEAKTAAYIASKEHKQDQFAARAERGL